MNYWFICVATVMVWVLFLSAPAFAQDESRGKTENDQDDPRQRALQLQQLGTSAPKEEPKQGGITDRALEHIEQLEERATEERKREELSPRDRARQRIRALEIEEELKAAREEREAQERLREGAEPKARAQFFLRLFGPLVRIYDEILTQTGALGKFYDDLLDRPKDAPNLLYEAIGEPKGITLGGHYRIRYETLNGRFRRGEVGSDQQIAHQTRVYFGVKDIFDPVRFTLEGQDARVSLTDEGSFVNNTHVNHFDVLQLRLGLVTDHFLGTNVHAEFNIGRMTIDLGRRRWVARNAFRNTTNVFDGMHLLLGEVEGWQLETFLLQPAQQFRDQLDQFFQISRFGQFEDTMLWGLYGTKGGEGRLRTDVYYLGHRTRVPHRDFDMLGFRFYALPKTGEFNFEVESAYQFGDISPRGRFEHFQHAEIGYTYDLPWTPEPMLKFDYASAGLDTMYGARAFEFHPTGIFGPIFRGNMISPAFRFLVRPKDTLSVFVQHRAFWLADGRAPWRGSGLVDPTGAAGTFLGHSIDTRIGVDIAQNLFLQAGFVQFYFGGFARTAPDSPGSQRADYGYVFTTFLF
jgi:hypothetical protein